MEQKRFEEAKMIVKFFNYQKNRGYNYRTDKLQNAVIKAIEINGLRDLQNFIKTYYGTDIYECLVAYKVTKTNGNQDKPREESIPQPQPQQLDVTSAMGILEKAMISIIGQMSSDKIENKVSDNVIEKLNNYIKETYGKIEKKINLEVNGEKRELKGILHNEFDTVFSFVACDEPVFLVGPAGSGKNIICKQIADSLGLEFYYSNAVTQEYKITGFTDAMGNYQQTQFFQAWTKGGLFLLDEMDASIEDVLIILNSAIANKYFDFPAPIGRVDAHEKFRIVACGNTYGKGADSKYVGRTQLDEASLNRFAVVDINYCPKIEEEVANNNMELVNFIRKYRKALDEAGIQTVVSYREIKRIHKMEDKMSKLSKVLKTCLTKGLERDDINMIISNMSDNSKYFNALKELA